MKTVLYAIALIASTSAFAAKDCTPRFTGTGEGGQGYTDYPCGDPAARATCLEGEIGHFPTTNYGAEGGPSEVTRVCHNGTFFGQRSRPVKHLRCIEGELTSIPTTTYGAEGGPVEVTYVCHNGRFAPRY
jgi:hypothetical protein